MNYVLKFKKEKFSRKFWYDYYFQIWFRYHTCFFKSLIFKGNKIRAFNLFVNVKKGLKNKEFLDPYLVFLVAMIKITPFVLLRIKRLGGMRHGVPMPISLKKRIVFSVKWVIKLLRDKNINISADIVADLLVSSIYDKGLSIEKKSSVYKTARRNRHMIKFFN